MQIRQTIERLIEKEKEDLAGLDLDQQDDSGYTALMTASLQGDIASVELLLRSGADPDIENNEGETAIMLAIEENNYQMVKVLSRFANLNYENKYSDNALAHAKYYGADYIAQFLIFEGASETGKPTRMEESDAEIAEAERQNTVDLNAIFPNKTRHPFFERLDVLKPPHLCEKYMCSTCGGIIHHIKENLTPELRHEIEQFIIANTEEQLIALGSSTEQLKRLVSLAEQEM